MVVFPTKWISNNLRKVSQIGTLCIILLVGGLTAFSQTKCDHISDSRQRFEQMRIMPPVKILDWDGKRISYSFIDREGIAFGSFDVDADTTLDADFIKAWRKGEWWIVYCNADRHVYFIQRFNKQEGKVNAAK